MNKLKITKILKTPKKTTLSEFIRYSSAIKRLESISTIEIFIGYLHLAEIIKIIKGELKGKSGIYGFLCIKTRKLYIGSSLDLSTRFNEHLKGDKSNIKLQMQLINTIYKILYLLFLNIVREKI